MKKLALVMPYSKVYGKVIERDSSRGYCMRDYHENENGEYGYDESDIPSLSPMQEHSVISRPLLAQRVKRLRSFFPKAKYISLQALDFLNFDEENYEETLKNVVDFSQF